MTPQPASNTLTPAPKFAIVDWIAPQIQKATHASSAPWVFSTLEQVREIESTGRLLPGLGDLRIEPQTVNRARQIVSSIGVNLLPVPLVAPISGGGIAMTWSVGSKEVKLDFEPDGATYCFAFENDEMLEDSSKKISSTEAVTDRLRWLISRKG